MTNPSHVLFPPVGRSFFFTLLSLLFSSFARAFRILVPSCFLSVSVDWKSFLFASLIRRIPVLLPVLFRGSGTGRLSWFRTDYVVGLRVIRISVERITQKDKVRSDDYTLHYRRTFGVNVCLILSSCWTLLSVRRDCFRTNNSQNGLLNFSHLSIIFYEQSLIRWLSLFMLYYNSTKN